MEILEDTSEWIDVEGTRVLKHRKQVLAPEVNVVATLLHFMQPHIGVFGMELWGISDWVRHYNVITWLTDREGYRDGIDNMFNVIDSYVDSSF